MNDSLKKVLCSLLGLDDKADEAVIAKALSDKEAPLRAGLAGRGGVVLTAETLTALRLKENASATEIHERVVELAGRETQLAALGVRLAQLEDAKITTEVDAAIAAFKYAPAERELQLKLARSNVELWREVTALRVPANPGGDAVKGADKARVTGAARNLSAREAAQLAAVDAYLAANKGVDYAAAVVACAKAQPDVFAPEEV